MPSTRSKERSSGAECGSSVGNGAAAVSRNGDSRREPRRSRSSPTGSQRRTPISYRHHFLELYEAVESSSVVNKRRGKRADSSPLRPPKPQVDPWRPLDVLVEEERWSPMARMRRSMTVFLAGSECPFTCVFCDLWQYTLDEPTPPGAIPQQLEIALVAEVPIS